MLGPSSTRNSTRRTAWEETIASTLVAAVSELKDVLHAKLEGAAKGDRMALATIVEVKGSTYRREGARLLIPERGKPVGTISGGCLEGDVREAAAEVMAEGHPRLLHFDLTADDEVVWGWGLGCNGVIDVFVEPADGAVHAAGTIRRAVDQQQALVAVTVVQLSEDGGVRLGARLIVHADGTVDGSLGDPAIDRQGRSEGLRAWEDGRSGAVRTG